MKKIKKDTPHLFLRLGDYEQYDYIDEHKKIDVETGSVWLLKIGKTINKDFLKKIVESKGGIILKKSASKGNQFYYADLIDINILNDDNAKYPKYYDEYLYFEGLNIEDVKKNGYWFKISNIREISNDVVSKFIINSNDKSVLDYALKTRVVHMYIRNCEEICI